MAKKLLQAIFFDIDDTICATFEFTKEARRNALVAMQSLGLKLPFGPLYDELNEVIAEFSSNHPQHFDKLLARIPPETYNGINPAILVAAAVDAYHNTKYHSLKSFPDVIPFLEKLSPFPIIKGIISDGLAIKQAEKLLLLKIYPFLTARAIFISEQMGISKVNPKIYLHACQKVGVQPGSTMFVGDHPERDIDTSNQVGLISVKIRRMGKYGSLQGKTRPQHDVQDLNELWTIIQNEYELSS